MRIPEQILTILYLKEQKRWRKLSLCITLGLGVQLLSCVWLLVDPMDCSMPGFPEFTQTHVHWVDDDIQPSHLCHPLLLLPSIFPSIRVFSSESALHIRWPKDWSFSFTSVRPVNIQGWLPLGLTGLTFLLSKELSKVFSRTTVRKY